MLILPEESRTKALQEERQALTSHYNSELEKILNANKTKEKYWILGKVAFPQEFDGKVGRTFLQACDEKPGLVKNSFVYEVDNNKGTKDLLWIFNPDGSLRFPGLNKTIQATPVYGRT